MAEGAAGPKKKEEKDFYFGKVIGEGSFSVVYLAREKNSSKEVAIKVCSKELISREKKSKAIMTEKAVMTRITQEWKPTAPFFVRLGATFQNTKHLYFVMTLGKRGDMLKFIKRMAAQEVDVTQFYAAELLQALEHLHSLGIIHRDLKPENILLSSNMHILVTDFGSAKIIDAVEEVPEVAEGEEGRNGRRSSFVGTAQYVSPEVLNGQVTTPAADLWALGCILYQMVTGMPPFVSQSEYLIFQKIQALNYSFHEGFDPQARDLVTKLLVPDPESRLGAGQQCQGYTDIKNHSFFKGIDFDSLHLSTPPGVPEGLVGDPNARDSVWERYPDMQTGLGSDSMSRLLKEQIDSGGSTEDEEDDDTTHSCTSESSCLPESGNIGDMSADERTRLLDLQRQNNEYHSFVEGNLILKQGILDKKKGLWSRRRMFLLTEGPRLFYVDPKEKVMKGEIPWSQDMRCEMKDFRIFFVHTPNRIYYLIDPSSFATKWCEAIDGVRSFYFPHSNAS